MKRTSLKCRFIPPEPSTIGDGARVRLDVGGPSCVHLYGTIQSTTRTRAMVLWTSRTSLEGSEELARPWIDEVRIDELAKVTKET